MPDQSGWTPSSEPWWTVKGEVLLDALRRANQGEEPDLLYAELYANTESQEDDA